MSHSMKQAMAAFNTLFGKTQKVVTFNKYWAAGLQSIEGAVNNPDFRLILSHGEIVKSIDSHGRRCLLIGTCYGLVAINETVFKSNDPVQPLHYVTTKALSAIWESYKHIHFPVSDYAHASNVPAFMSEEFLASVAELAEMEIQCGRKPSDGLPKYIVGKPKDKSKERRASNDRAPNAKQAHGRRQNDDKKVAHFKHKKKTVKIGDPTAAQDIISAEKVKDPQKKHKPRKPHNNIKALPVANKPPKVRDVARQAAELAIANA